MRMFFSLALFVAVVATGAAADPPTPVKALSLSISRPVQDVPRELGVVEATSVYLFTSLPGREVVCLDPASSKVVFTDDKDTSLFGPPGQRAMSPYIRTDTKTKSQVAFTIFGQKAPVAGALKVRIKGELVFLCGSGEKSATVESLPLRAKEKAEAGPAVFEVAVFNEQASVTLKTESPLVKSVAFTGSDGKPLATPPVNLVGGMGGKPAQYGYFAVPPRTQTIGIKVVYYEKLEAVSVPIDVEVGVGG